MLLALFSTHPLTPLFLSIKFREIIQIHSLLQLRLRPSAIPNSLLTTNPFNFSTPQSQMVEYLKSTLNEGLQSWIHTAASYLPHLPLPGVHATAQEEAGQRKRRTSREREMSEMGDRDRDSLWSSEDGKSHDLSLTDDVEENYFACPIDDSLLQFPDEIEEAIDKIKSLVLETEGITQERRALVQRLISLRLRLQDVREVEEERGDAPEEEFRIVCQHHFLIQKQIVHRAPQYCDKCLGIIWTVIQSWYRCKACAYQCHAKCLNNVVRKCASQFVSVETEYIPQICPEVGLPDQNYQCFECKTRFTLKNSWMEPRRCDYNGRYYCPLCHKNNTFPIPARILHNWDFQERPVAEESRQFLTLMARKPNINLDKVNPKLFSFVEDLNVVKRYREDFIMMKDFFRTCRNALSQKLLRKLDERQHFVETSCMYSLQDLIDVNAGTMLKFVEKVHNEFEQHIRRDCEICKGKGFICEICDNDQIIFPFDSAVHQCPQCHSVFHNVCFAKRDSCPKCLRKSRRASSTPVK